MADMTWTAEQLAAITARNPGILVSAGAGSGKTAVLTERVVSRIFDAADPVDADRMLIVTFTRAAAEEMRQRIAARLRAIQLERPGDRAVARQMILLEQADISTVHAFCQRLIRENFQLLGIESGFRVADDRELGIWREDAAAEVLEEGYAAGEPAFLELVELFAGERDDRQVTRTLLTLYDFVRAHPFYHRWMEQSVAAYHSDAPLLQTPWGEELLAAALDSAAEAARAAAEAVELLEGDPKMEKAYGDALRLLARDTRTVEQALRAGNWDAAVEAVRTRQDIGFKSLRGYDDKEKKEAVTALRDRSQALLDTLKKKLLLSTEAEFAADREALAPLVEQLFSMVARFDERFFERKRRQNALDFSDLEHLTIRLLTGEDGAPTRLARELSERFRQVFVDEYQDTNAVQDLIFRSVSDGGKNLFMVGDVKQSIYRFRQADPAIFLGKKRAFTPWPAPAEEPVAIPLNRNFRSRQEVTEGINFLFDQLMTEPFGGIDYRAGERLEAGAVYPPSPDCGCEVHLLPREKGEGSARDREADYAAGLVAGLLASGTQVSDHGVLRPVRPGDICILLRSVKDKAAVYLEALARQGIGGQGDSGGGFLTSREVSAVVALLRAVDDPLLDVDLAAAMLSPLAAFTPDELAAIRLESPDRPLYACLTLHAARDEKSAAFLRLMHRLRTLAAQQPVSRLILDLYDLTGIEAVARAMENGRQRLQNLRLLPEYAAGFEERGYHGLGAFLRLLDHLAETGGDLEKGQLPPADGGAVTVMSIHKSKGLEFPVVILADCGKRFNTADLAAPALLHSELGFACIRRDPTRRLQYDPLPAAALRSRLDRELRSEELRMLYVALTRARERLILVGTAPGKTADFCRKRAAALVDGRLPASAVREGGSYLEWVTAALLHHPDGASLRDEAGLDTDLVPGCSGRFRVVLPTLDDEEEPVQETALPEPAAPDPARVAELRAAMDYRYPYEQATVTSSKFAISHLAEEVGAVSTPRFTARPSFLYRQGLTPAERGSAMHTFMQFCSYPAAARDAAAERDRLVAESFLTPEEGASLDLGRLAAFFDSPLYRRITAAGRVWREYRFLAVIGEEDLAGLAEAGLGGERTTVQGVADCIFEEDGSLVIVDFKTDRAVSPAELAERYRVQLGLYGRLIGRSLGRPVRECLLYSFALGREVPVEF